MQCPNALNLSFCMPSQTHQRFIFKLLIISMTVSSQVLHAEDLKSLNERFASEVLPLLEQKCFSCHQGNQPKAGFEMTRYRSLEKVREDHRQWSLILELLQNEEMPPPDAKESMSAEQRSKLVEWIGNLRKLEAQALDGDPGPRPARRMSNAEYDNTVRDLLGADIRPSTNFPLDHTNKAGFSNDANILTITPAQIEKYQQAASEVSKHLALLTDRLAFSPVPMIDLNNYEEFCIQHILNFYGRVKSRCENLSGHLYGLVRRRNATKLGLDSSELRKIEDGEELAQPYLTLLEQELKQTAADTPLVLTRLIETLNRVDLSDENNARKTCEELAKYIHRQVARLPRWIPPVAGQARLSFPGVPQPRRFQYLRNEAENRHAFNAPSIKDRENWNLRPADRIGAYHEIALRLPCHPKNGLKFGFGLSSDRKTEAALKIAQISLEARRFDPNTKRHIDPPESIDYWDWLKTNKPELANKLFASDGTVALKVNTRLDWTLPADAFPYAQQEDQLHLNMLLKRSDDSPALLQLHDIQTPLPGEPKHGDIAYALEPYLLNQASRQNFERLIDALACYRRLLPSAWMITHRSGYPLSAELYHQKGFFRDDLPLYTLFLTPDEQRELDRLWDNLFVTTLATERLYREFLSFERSEAGPMVNRDFDFIKAESPEAIDKNMIERVRDLYLTKYVKNEDKAAYREYFAWISRELERESVLRQKSEKAHLETMPSLVEQLWRRPLDSTEKSALLDHYRDLRENLGMPHREAIQDVFTAALSAPQFLFLSEKAPAGVRWEKVDHYAMASRLSYFLWASMPDRELLELAAQNKLHDPNVLKQQATRMLQDSKIIGFSTEFVSSWLNSKPFHNWNGVDRTFHGKAYDDALQQALYEEPIRFAEALFKQDGSFFDLLYGDYVLVNQRLATHYGLPFNGPKDQWQRIDVRQNPDRGGILGMGVFMTMHAAGLGTSPVKRGHWLVSKVLGEHIPPPPADVPQLPESEANLGDLTLREILSKHREHPNCAGCHRRFDGYGIVFEGHDPIGRSRHKDLGGKPIDRRTELPDGTIVEDLRSLKNYLRKNRNLDYVRHLARQLLIFALGRELLVSDDPLLAKLQLVLLETDGKVEAAVHAIVISAPFVNIRGHQ